MQQAKQQIFDSLRPQCIGKSQSFFVCIQQDCVNNSFMCSNVKCICSDSHKKCIISRISNIFESIQAQKQSIDQQTQKALQMIEGIYDDVIDKLSKERTQFLQAIPYFGLKQQSLKFIFQLQSNPQEINGQIMNKLYKELQIEDLKVRVKPIKQIQCKIPEIQKQIQTLVISIGNFTYKESCGFQIDSKILKKRHQPILFDMFPSSVKNLTLLYRASQNNFSASKFRKATDQQSNTLTIIQTQVGKIIGGYTPLKWEMSNIQKSQQDVEKQSFLFSITQRQKYPIKDTTKAIVNSKYLGPCFGTDLKLGDSCNSGYRCETDFPSYYSNTKLQAKPKSFRCFAGSNKFNVKQYEVFKIDLQKNKKQAQKEQKEGKTHQNLDFPYQYIDDQFGDFDV